MANRIKAVWFSLGAGVLAACGGPPPATASRQPEVTLTNVDVACVRASLMNGVVNNGFQIAQSTDSMIVAKRISSSVGATIAYGTRFSGAPEERITITMISPAPDTLRVIVYGAYVSNPGTAFERSNPVQATQADQESFVNGARNAGCKKST